MVVQTKLPSQKISSPAPNKFPNNNQPEEEEPFTPRNPNMTSFNPDQLNLKHFFIIKTFEGNEKIMEAESDVEKQLWLINLKKILEPQFFTKEENEDILTSINQFRIVDDDPQPYYTMPLSEIYEARQYMLFNSPDTSENIVFEENTNEVKLATLPKLVEKLTQGNEQDNNFLFTFMLTYKSFTTPLELLRLLIIRYNSPPAMNCTREEFRIFKQTFLFPTRLRILNVIKYWTEKHYYDFKEEFELCSQMRDFIDGQVSKTRFDSAAGKLLKVLDSISRRVRSSVPLFSGFRIILELN